MKKKYTDETYLKGVSKYNVIIKELKEQNAYVVVKKILAIDEPFIINVTLIDDGYYIIEYTPVDKFYNARAFIDRKLNTISYYFDISLGNGVDNGRPYYDDLYLDIVCGEETNHKPKVLDEDELRDALENGKITNEQFDLANTVCSKLMEEIQNNENIFINMNKKEIITNCKLEI